MPDSQQIIQAIDLYRHAMELYGVLALTGSCLLYACVLHLRVRTLARNYRDRSEGLESRLAQSAEAIERLRLQQEEKAEQPPVQAAPLGQALNLNKRGQVLRMQRRGENPETIAGALGIPRNEVDLLLKVHQMTLERVGPVESGARA